MTRIGLPRPQDLNVAFQGALGGAQQAGGSQQARPQEPGRELGFGGQQTGSHQAGHQNPFAGGSNPFESISAGPTASTKFGSYQANGLEAVKGVDISNPQNVGHAPGFGGQMNPVGQRLYLNA